MGGWGDFPLGAVSTPQELGAAGPCWLQGTSPSRPLQGIMLLSASDIWVKMLNYLAAVARWILKQLTNAKNRQLDLFLGFCQKAAVCCSLSSSLCLMLPAALGVCFSLSERRLRASGTAVLGRGSTRLGVLFFFFFFLHYWHCYCDSGQWACCIACLQRLDFTVPHSCCGDNSRNHSNLKGA